MKNYLLGVVFLLLAFYLIWEQGTQQIEENHPYEPIHSSAKHTKVAPESNQSLAAKPDGNSFISAVSPQELPIHQTNDLSEEILVPGLSTDLSSIVFTNHTG